MRIIQIALSFNVAAILFGQQPSSVNPPSAKPPALEVKREQPGTGPVSIGAAVPQILQQYDFGPQLKALQGGEPFTFPSDVNPEFAVPSKAGSGQASEGGAVPKDYRPKVDVPLTATALEAVRVSERWRGEKNSPATGSDGRVLYSFGAGLPTVVCAPLSALQSKRA